VAPLYVPAQELFIVGIEVRDPHADKPIAGVHIVATGKAGRYEATTNERGEFRIKVPAGQYSVVAFKSGMSFEEYFLGYEYPGNVQIEPGGAAQIEFEPKRN
jgi:hypothetical protein